MAGGNTVYVAIRRKTEAGPGCVRQVIAQRFRRAGVVCVALYPRSTDELGVNQAIKRRLVSKPNHQVAGLILTFCRIPLERNKHAQSNLLYPCAFRRWFYRYAGTG
jgi:hypothetical protein